jgi:hypothetical protein
MTYTVSDLLALPEINGNVDVFDPAVYRKLSDADWMALREKISFSGDGQTNSIIESFITALLIDLKNPCRNAWSFIADPFVDFDTCEFTTGGWIANVASEPGKRLKAFIENNQSCVASRSVHPPDLTGRLAPLGKLDGTSYYYGVTFSDGDSALSRRWFGCAVRGPQSTASDLIASAGPTLTLEPVSHISHLADDFCELIVSFLAIQLIRAQNFGSPTTVYTGEVVKVSVFEIGSEEIYIPTVSYDAHVSIPPQHRITLSIQTDEPVVDPPTIPTPPDTTPPSTFEIPARVEETPKKSGLSTLSIVAIVSGIVIGIVVIAAAIIAAIYFFRRPGPEDASSYLYNWSQYP